MKIGSTFFYYAPRILSIGFALFLAVFALDVFGQYSGMSIVLPLFIHLLPTLALLLLTTIAWKYEWVGAAAFLGFALLYLWEAGFSRPLSWYLAIDLPTTIIGALYLAAWWQSKTKRGLASHQAV